MIGLGILLTLINLVSMVSSIRVACQILQVGSCRGSMIILIVSLWVINQLSCIYLLFAAHDQYCFQGKAAWLKGTVYVAINLKLQQCNTCGHLISLCSKYGLGNRILKWLFSCKLAKTKETLTWQTSNEEKYQKGFREIYLKSDMMGKFLVLSHLI